MASRPIARLLQSCCVLLVARGSTLGFGDFDFTFDIPYGDELVPSSGSGEVGSNSGGGIPIPSDFTMDDKSGPFVRLVSGEVADADLNGGAFMKQLIGRLKIYKPKVFQEGHRWTAVCYGPSWTVNSRPALLVCQELGHGHPKTVAPVGASSPYKGGQDENIWEMNVSCNEADKRIDDCREMSQVIDTCPAEEAVMVECLPGTCITGWLHAADIPADHVREYQTVMEAAGLGEKKLRTMDIFVIASSFFKGNISHAVAVKKCLAQQTKNCKNFNPCNTGGRCDFNAKRQINVCSCPKGQTGDFCQKDCNECVGECRLHHDCHRPYGTCLNTKGSYQCHCRTGYKGNGQHCTDVDECLVGVSDCHSNATCTNTIGSFLCTCKVGFKGNGRKCQDICECCSSPCQHNGNCIEKVNGYMCQCSVGYEGKNCQTRCLLAHKLGPLPGIVNNLTKVVQQRTKGMENLNKSKCDHSQCVGGQCVSTAKSYLCICQWNYYGRHCQHKCPWKAYYSTRQKKCVCIQKGHVNLGRMCGPMPKG